MKESSPPVGGLVAGFAARLRFPYLLLITGSLFVLDLLVPDLIPFVDEILLGLGTLILAAWRKRADHKRPNGASNDGPVIDVE